MVRLLADKPTPAWKAFPAILVAAAALLWHVLACTESPMAFSPGGEHMAFVTMEPYDESHLPVAGTHAYRLMVLSKGKDLRVIEQTTSHMLTAPAWSADGKAVAYLRIPLLSAEQANKAEALLKHPPVTSAPAAPPADFDWPARDVPSPATRPAGKHTDLALPSLEGLEELYHSLATGMVAPAELVVRDVRTGSVTSAVRVEIPVVYEDDESLAQSIMMIYLLTRATYSPDGKWVYVNTGRVLMAIDPATGDSRILAAPVMAWALSPDGKTAATLLKGAIGLIGTDGARAVYVRWRHELSLSGLAWVDGKTLAVMHSGEFRGGTRDQIKVDFVTADGRFLPSRSLRVPAKGDGHHAGELAISPNARYMVVSYGTDVYFLKSDGKVLGTWHHKSDLLVQPTFTPDSQQVAFKYMHEGERRAGGIALFTPDGKHLRRVRIPPIAPGTTRPATRPVRTGPTED